MAPIEPWSKETTWLGFTAHVSSQVIRWVDPSIEFVSRGRKQRWGQSAALLPSVGGTVLVPLGMQRWTLLFRSKFRRWDVHINSHCPTQGDFLFQKAVRHGMKNLKELRLLPTEEIRALPRKVAFQRDFDWQVAFEGVGTQRIGISSRGFAANNGRGKGMRPAPCDRCRKGRVDMGKEIPLGRASRVTWNPPFLLSG